MIVLTGSEALKTGISVKTQLADGLPLIEGDRVQLQQVLLNLVVNAIQAMATIADGARDLLITTAPTGSNFVLVRVADSGPDSIHRCSSMFSIHITLPSLTAWAWAWQSAVQLLMPTTDACGRAPTSPAAPSFSSRYRLIRAAELTRLGIRKSIYGQVDQFHDAGFSVARRRPCSTVTCCNGNGFTRSGASLVFVASRSSCRSSSAWLSVRNDLSSGIVGPSRSRFAVAH